MHIGALETYLRELWAVRPVGVKETAFYPALATLLNTVGKSLRPQVHCVTHPRGQGAGLPDGGLFTRDQLQGIPSDKAMERQIPARGVLEVKGSAADISSLVGSEQVARYGEVLGPLSAGPGDKPVGVCAGRGRRPRQARGAGELQAGRRRAGVLGRGGAAAR